jgi:hypothetical protein
MAPRPTHRRRAGLRVQLAGWHAGQPISWGIYRLGQVQRAQGRLAGAADTYRKTLDIAAVSCRPPAPSAGPAHVGRGEVAYQRNELDSALRQVTERIALCRQFLYPAPLIVFLDLRVTTARQLLVDCFLAGFDGVVRYHASHC